MNFTRVLLTRSGRPSLNRVVVTFARTSVDKQNCVLSKLHICNRQLRSNRSLRNLTLYIPNKRLLSCKSRVTRIGRTYSHLAEGRQQSVAMEARIVKSAGQINPPEERQQKKYFYRRTLPSSCISFSSEEGKKIFTEALLAGYMEGYYSLASQFCTQDEPAFCGLSTLVMVLNSLEVDPKRVWKGVWRWYHEYMLDCCVPIKVVEENGITVDQFACLAACNSLNVQMVRGDSQLTEERLRADVKAMTTVSDKVIAVSYSRKTFGQTGDGHFSPIGGYHPERDLVLILDTARFKYPPHWVQLSTLCEAMRALDPVTGAPRAYMILQKTEDDPPVLFHVSPQLSVNSTVETQKPERGLNTFLQHWKDWLLQKSSDQSSEDMWCAAICQFLTALECLESDFLLTTQGYLNCTMSSEHTCAVRELLNDLEKHQLYPLVEKALQKLYKATSPTPAPNGGGRCSTTYAVCDTLLCDTKDCETCGFRLDLEVQHFVTMLLLAWPYAKCGGNHGNALGQIVTTSLVDCSAVFQNEVGQLRRQLGSLLGYREMCENCQCRV